MNDRLARLIDAVVDGVLDKVSFEERRYALLQERQTLEQAVNRGTEDQSRTDFILKAFELACSAQQSYRLASKSRKA